MTGYSATYPGGDMDLSEVHPNMRAEPSRVRSVLYSCQLHFHAVHQHRIDSASPR